MNPVLRRSAAHVVVESLDAPAISDADAHHLGRVLRIRPSDAITVTDGRGAWAPATWSAHAGLALTGAVVTEPALPGGPRCVACAIPKGDRPELIVQKATELGIDRITFVETARSVVRWDAPKAAKQLERLRRIAREAAMQSRRVRLPEVDHAAFESLVGGPAVALAEPGAPPWGPEHAHVRTVVIGPEGGFTDDELAGRLTVELVGTVLRVETAAIVAALLLLRV